MLLSGIKETLVPRRALEGCCSPSSIKAPNSKAARLACSSRTDSTTKEEESALTALVPTPFRPTDFLNARESYFPPVFILETTSTTFPKGIPRP